MVIKLMPKEYAGQGPLTPGQGRPLPIFKVISVNFFFSLAIVCLSLTLVSYLVLTIYNYSLEQKQASLEEEVKKLEETRDLDLESQVVELQKRIKIFQKLLASHIYPSKLFILLEEVTIPQVQFITFNADLTRNKLNLAGQTASYSFLAKQLTVLENDERIKKSEISGIALGQSGVSFDLLLEFDPVILRSR